MRPNGSALASSLVSPWWAAQLFVLTALISGCRGPSARHPRDQMADGGSREPAVWRLPLDSPTVVLGGSDDPDDDFLKRADARKSLDAPYEYLVIGPDGRVLGSVSLPSTVMLLDIWPDVVVVRERDDDDHELVKVVPIRK